MKPPVSYAMDPGAQRSDGESGFEEDDLERPRTLPADLPKSLDDRQPVRNYGAETEMYDAWQGMNNGTASSVSGFSLIEDIGQSQFLTSPMPAQPLAFNLSLEDDAEDETAAQQLEDNDTRLMEMLAAQAAHREDGSGAGDEEDIVMDKKMSEHQKKTLLQKSLHNAASNGDVEQVGRLIHGPAQKFIDINGPDEEGTAPIIYASCFVS